MIFFIFWLFVCWFYLEIFLFLRFLGNHRYHHHPHHFFYIRKKIIKLQKSSKSSSLSSSGLSFHSFKNNFFFVMCTWWLHNDGYMMSLSLSMVCVQKKSHCHHHQWNEIWIHPTKEKRRREEANGEEYSDVIIIKPSLSLSKCGKPNKNRI